MKGLMLNFIFWTIGIISYGQALSTDPVALFRFDDNVASKTASVNYTHGLEGKALRLRSGYITLTKDTNLLRPVHDFTIQCWIKSSANPQRPFTILSKKNFTDNSLASQKLAGWAFYMYGGTWAWNMGSGKRRITHENENGNHMPLTDGKWHQLTMTYSNRLSEVRLYYDGENKAIYNVSDSVGFDFTSNFPLTIGGQPNTLNGQPAISPDIYKGAEKLQSLVDAYNQLGLGKLKPVELEDLVTEYKILFDNKVAEMKLLKGSDSITFLTAMQSADLGLVTRARTELMRNPFTIHQVKDFMKVAPLLKIYSLSGDKIIINKEVAMAYTEKEKLYPPDFDIDNLAVWHQLLTPIEVRAGYEKFLKPSPPELKHHVASITAANWNIHHGGKHNTITKDGWDSRMRIVEMLKEENADVIMMQETYSSGDFIATELGYYFASTVDWDYLNQGANVSVLSRYPIKELYVPKGAPFMHVAVKVSISKTQDIYVMSNWYGMQQFPAVFDFHQERFQQTDQIPVIFAGDFNAVPHTDGGNSPASVKMLAAGFTDAYRNKFPNVKTHPGYSHDSNARIDQLYYKGKGLKHVTTKLITTWPGGFPSDHALIISTFDLK